MCGPQVGERCKADPEEEGKFEYGVITAIDYTDGVAYSDLAKNFGGDIPTRMRDGVWIFDAF